MNNSPKLLFKPIEDKTIVWLSHKNEYLVLENQTASILQQLGQGKPITQLAEEVSVELNTPISATKNFIENLSNDLLNNKETKESEEILKADLPIEFNYIKFYKINNLIFKVAFNNEIELSYVHPKFAHLVIDNPKESHHTFSVFTKEKNIYFYVDNVFIGGWTNKDIHYFQGKFSMELIQKIHEKKEQEWLGVFHASAVSNGEKAILFLGDSGNGKSTSLSLLQASGFTCLADDFVPVDADKNQVYSFPAAISIKKTSVPVLLPFFPELNSSAEYHFTRLNKIVRYLKPNNTNYSSYLPCKDLVFIKYKKDSILNCTKISNINAFQQLVPDSWLSPIEKNAKTFLDWFSNLSCYQITYSENDKMVNTVSKIFDNEL